MFKEVKEFLEKEWVIYSLSILFLVLAYGWTIFSYNNNSEDGLFFARSGSVMVLFAVIVEYALSNIKKEVETNDFTVNGQGVMQKRDLPKIYTVLKSIAHITVVVGTFIWGYGDCFSVSLNLCN